MTDISRYLRFLQDSGWSDLIDSRWKEQVHHELLERFPEMSDGEWRVIEDVLFS